MEGSIADVAKQAERRLARERGTSIWRMAGRVVVSLVLVAAVLAAGFGAFRWMVATRPQVATTPPVERARLVEARTIRVGEVAPILTLFGQIVPGRAVDLRVLVAGEVRATSPNLVDGGRVRAGETLVEVDRFEYEGALVRARADLAEAEARIVETDARVRSERDAVLRAREQLAISEREIQRLTLLQSREAASEAQLDQSRSRVSTAQGALETRENQIAILEAQRRREEAALPRLRHAVDRAQRDLDNTRLIAPFDAVVSNPGADRGRLMSVNDRVASLTDLSRLEARFTLNDAQYARLSQGGGPEGRAARVVWRAGDIANEKPATIARVAPTVTTNTGGFDVFAVIGDPARAAALRPGAFVELVVGDRVVADAVSLPTSALHGDVVYAIGADDRLRAIPVRRVGFDGENIVLRGGFASGDRILTSRLTEAANGVLVEVRR